MLASIVMAVISHESKSKPVYLKPERPASANMTLSTVQAKMALFVDTMEPVLSETGSQLPPVFLAEAGKKAEYQNDQVASKSDKISVRTW